MDKNDPENIWSRKHFNMEWYFSEICSVCVLISANKYKTGKNDLKTVLLTEKKCLVLSVLQTVCSTFFLILEYFIHKYKEYIVHLMTRLINKICRYRRNAQERKKHTNFYWVILWSAKERKKQKQGDQAEHIHYICYIVNIEKHLPSASCQLSVC